MTYQNYPNIPILLFNMQERNKETEKIRHPNFNLTAQPFCVQTLLTFLDTGHNTYF